MNGQEGRLSAVSVTDGPDDAAAIETAYMGAAAPAAYAHLTAVGEDQ